MKNRKHNHYFKDVTLIDFVDVYRVLKLFDVVDPAIAHATKKLLVAGGRGVKDIDKDVKEAIDTLLRWQEIRSEDSLKNIDKEFGRSGSNLIETDPCDTCYFFDSNTNNCTDFYVGCPTPKKEK